MIEIRNISKQYTIGRKEAYGSLRDEIMQAIAAPFRRGVRALGTGEEDNTIWALRDVSFNVQEGEVIGIIGRNGAGKSTLLKILSRITEPTSGRIVMRGRVASLLEVGTGFHPELTGRENIFLNGALLGMSRQEIKARFDEIVAFSEIEKFLDTPVKRYSSGMYVRLAFAVAAHLEPEILIVDEVLAVGDIRFQRKCMDRMGYVSKEGRTVLFVSHSMPAVTRLCQRALMFGEGRVLQDGPAHQVVTSYFHSDLGTTAMREWPDLNKAPGDDVVRLRAVSVQTEEGKISDSIDIRYPFVLEMRYDVLKSGAVLTPIIRLTNQEGIVLFTAIDVDTNWRKQRRPTGQYITKLQIPGDLLAEGNISVLASISTISPTTKRVYEKDVISFQIVDNMTGDSARGDWGGDVPGVIRPLLSWVTEKEG
ncbi:MAG: ATP-binding cassette domain-containing protein [Nitrospirae bacterium]|nr:ATP-binding cassette domain-containing protein [Nitrospirota bacterium]